MIKLSPSLLGANPIKLLEETENCIQCDCDEIHYDVMDGHFVPNLSFGTHTLSALSKTAKAFYDVHLMISSPLAFIKPFVDAGANNITIHVETDNPLNTIREIKRYNIKAGISLKPETKIETIYPFLNEVDRVLIMTVNPGFGGQKLIFDMLKKVEELRKFGYKGDIQADGGITKENAYTLVESGVNILVMGSSYFENQNKKDLTHYIHSIKKCNPEN